MSPTETTAFGHRVELYKPDPNRPAWASTPLCTTVRGKGKDRKGCEGVPAYLASYLYISGRRGRVTTNRKLLCLECARIFAKRRGLELP